MNCQGCLGGSRERILPTCGPSLITPKGQWRDPDAIFVLIAQQCMQEITMRIKKMNIEHLTIAYYGILKHARR